MPLSFEQLYTYQIGLVQAQAYRNLQAIFRDALSPYHLTVPEWSLLGIVYGFGEIGLSNITQMLKSKASHPSTLVDHLAARGLLDRRPDPDDRRNKIISITAAGRDLVPEVEKATRASMNLALSGIDRSELVEYFMMLRRLAELDVQGISQTDPFAS